jgi:hypothetical protein
MCIVAIDSVLHGRTVTSGRRPDEDAYRSFQLGSIDKHQLKSDCLCFCCVEEHAVVPSNIDLPEAIDAPNVCCSDVNEDLMIRNAQSSPEASSR